MDIGREPIRPPDSGSSPTEDPAGTEKPDGFGKSKAANSLEELSVAADVARRKMKSSGHGDSSAGAGPIPRSFESRRARVEEARQKMAQGYYSRPEVRNKIADKLADNMNP